MNRKIMLLPLSAAVLLGLASCGPTEDSKESSIIPSTTSSVEPPASSSVEEPYDGGISDLAVGDVAITGVVGHIGTNGWTIDDGKASAYVYGALANDFKVGDHVTVTGACEGYFGLYEVKNATVNKNEEKAPTLAAPVEITVADLDALHAVLAAAKQSDATWAPTNSKRYKITGLTAEDVDGYPGWSIAGFSDVEHTVGTTKCNPKIVSYYYIPGNNATEANRNTKLYAGCTYDVSFYIGGTNKNKNVNMNIFDVVAHYDAVTEVTVTGETEVEVGGNITLKGAVLPATADQGLTWTSSDTAVATVDNGKVKGVAEGNVTITATSTADNTKSKTYAVTVKAPSKVYTKVASISFASDSNVDVNSEGNTGDDPTVVYTSSDGLVIENHKGASSTANRIWSSSDGHVRLYQNSKVVFNCDKNFSRIVVSCTSDKYNPGNTVLPAGATAEIDDKTFTITITLAAEAKTFTIEKMAAQIRVTNVEVQN